MASFLSDGVYQVGNGVTAPERRLGLAAQYTKRARAAGIEGTVVMTVTVGEDGLARDMRIEKSLGHGLDEKAIEAVGTWRFRPGLLDGQPVPVGATIEVPFSLETEEKYKAAAQAATR